MTKVATYPEKMGNIVKFEENRSRGLSRTVAEVTCVANGTNTVNLAGLGFLIAQDDTPLRTAEITAASDIKGILVHLEEGPFEAAGAKKNCVLIQRDSVLAGTLETTNTIYTGAYAAADGSGDVAATLVARSGITSGADGGDGEATSAGEIATALAAINSWLDANNIRVDRQV